MLGYGAAAAAAAHDQRNHCAAAAAQGPAAALVDAVDGRVVVAWSRVSGQMDVCAMETRVAGEAVGPARVVLECLESAFLAVLRNDPIFSLGTPCGSSRG